MNRGLLEKAISMIGGNPDFTMMFEFYSDLSGDYDCRTPGCIAGHIIAAASPAEHDRLPSNLNYVEQAAALAEIGKGDRDALFIPDTETHGYDCNATDNSLSYISRGHALRCLRKFVETGVVDWKGTAIGEPHANV